MTDKTFELRDMALHHAQSIWPRDIPPDDRFWMLVERCHRWLEHGDARPEYPQEKAA